MEPIKLTSLFSASLVTLGVTYAPLGVAKPTPNPIVTESGMAVVPFLNLSTGYNDNLAKSNQQQDSSAFSVIESGVGFIVEPQSSKTQLGYRFRNGTYFSSQQDNFTDHYLDLTSDWELNSRHRIGFEYNLALAHEGRGENDTTLGLDYNQYESTVPILGMVLVQQKRLVGLKPISVGKILLIKITAPLLNIRIGMSCALTPLFIIRHYRAPRLSRK